MSNIYLTLADEFEKIAAVYRTLAADSGAKPAATEQAPPAEPPETKTGKPALTLERVRAVLAEKSQSGKTAEVRALLLQFGAAKLSEIEPDKYSKLLKAAEGL